LLIGSSAFAAGTFYFGGKKQTLSSSTDEVQAGYYDHQFLSAVIAGLASANIKSGTTLFGITGTYGAGGMLQPTLTTTAVSSIAASTASSGGNISTDGGSPVTARGVCWNTTGSPTTADSKTTNGSGTGSFISSLTGLTAVNTYYVRAYAANSVGTAYGNEVSFTTVAVELATLTTTAVTNITTMAASSGGDISSDGGASVTARGVCWNTTGSPTTADSKTTNGSGTGSFISSLTGLTAGTTYYVRSYATNIVGTAYGDQVSFTTFFIGQRYGGGFIFYVEGNGLHGLIAAASDESTGDWSNVNSTLLGTTGTAIGSGESNTYAIIHQLGHTASAAKICDSYVTVEGGVTYDDWFLPSKDELNSMYVNQAEIGGFQPGTDYWSSSENNATTAWSKQFTTGDWDLNLKSPAGGRIRAVRKF